MKEQNYQKIDITKYIFACLIPLLHIPFETNIIVDISRQYFARLGVPFFFVTTGFLLTGKMVTKDRIEVFKKQFYRVGKLLLIWSGIYIIPAMLIDGTIKNALFRTLLFKTPAYLWYLTAVLFGLIPFCLIKSKKLRWGSALCLYLVGTLLSESYSWMTVSIPLYNEIFLTYRNGLFFAFPMMCVGELAYVHIGKRTYRTLAIGLISSFVLFCIEVTIARNRAGMNADMSMTILLPFVVFFLLSLLVSSNSAVMIYRPWMRTASTAIYVLQFAFIFAGKVAQKFLSIGNIIWIFVYIIVIIIPTLLIIKTENNSFAKIIF